MTTWGKLEEVKSVDIAGINSGEISGSSFDKVVLISVYDKGSFS